MRFQTSKLPEDQVFPISKGDAKRTFGETWLDSVSFGLRREFEWGSRPAPKKELPTGRVLLELMISIEWRVERRGELHAWAIVYQVPREEWSDERREAFVAYLGGKPREWLDRMENRPEAQRTHGPFLLVEDAPGGFRTYVFE